MKTRTCVIVLSMAACLLTAPLALAADDFLGTWISKAMRQGTEVTSELTFEKGADGALKGTMTGRRGTNDLSDVKVGEDGTLSFDRVLEYQGQQFTLSYSVKLEDGKLVGTMSSPRGEREFTAERAGGAGDVSFIGQWDVKFEIQGNPVDGKLVLNDDGAGNLSGTWTTQRGEGELKDIKIADGALTFVRELDYQGQSMTLNYAAKIEDGKLVGTISSDWGEFPFSGTKAEAEEVDRATQMMQRMDADGDGKITEEEAPGQMKDYFSMIDANADGVVDMDELKGMIEMMGGQRN